MVSEAYLFIIMPKQHINIHSYSYNIRRKTRAKTKIKKVCTIVSAKDFHTVLYETDRHAKAKAGYGSFRFRMNVWVCR